jgi:hypothetical protein
MIAYAFVGQIAIGEGRTGGFGDSAKVDSMMHLHLRAFVNDGHVAFATFLEWDSSCKSEESHPHACILSSVEEMDAFGRRVGWKPTYIGDWNHPRNQMMIRFEAAQGPRS